MAKCENNKIKPPKPPPPASLKRLAPAPHAM